MTKKLYVSLAAAVVVLMMAVAYQSNYLSYYNCMLQTKSDTITQKGVAHVAAQCRIFILEKAMTD